MWAAETRGGAANAAERVAAAGTLLATGTALYLAQRSERRAEERAARLLCVERRGSPLGDSRWTVHKFSDFPFYDVHLVMDDARSRVTLTAFLPSGER